MAGFSGKTAQEVSKAAIKSLTKVAEFPIQNS